MNWVTQCICCVPGTLGKWSCSKPDDLRGRNLPNICSREVREGWRAWGNRVEGRSERKMLRMSVL